MRGSLGCPRVVCRHQVSTAVDEFGEVQKGCFSGTTLIAWMLNVSKITRMLNVRSRRMERMLRVSCTCILSVVLKYAKLITVFLRSLRDVLN